MFLEKRFAWLLIKYSIGISFKDVFVFFELLTEMKIFVQIGLIIEWALLIVFF